MYASWDLTPTPQSITGASSTFLRKLMSGGELPFIQICKGARVEILQADLQRPHIIQALETRHERRRAKPAVPKQQGALHLDPEDPS